MSLIGLLSSNCSPRARPRIRRARRARKAHRTHRLRFSKSRLSFSNWGRICNPATWRRRSGLHDAVAKSAGREPDRTPTRSCKPSPNWGRTSNRETCRPRSRITRRSSRTRSRTPRKREAITAITITARKALSPPPLLPSNRIRSPRHSARWRRICRREIFRERNRRLRHFRTIFSKSAVSSGRIERRWPAQLCRRVPAA